MRNLDREVAVAQSLHRLHDRNYALRDASHHQEADKRADDQHHEIDSAEHRKGCRIGRSRVGGCLVCACIVEVDILAQDLVGLQAKLVDSVLVQRMRLVRHLPRFLARQLHHLLATGEVLVPDALPLLIDRSLVRRRDHRFVELGCLVDVVERRSGGLFLSQLVVKRLRQHVLADDVAIGDSGSPELAENADARQPVGRDVDRVGIHRPHARYREQAHRREHGEKQSNDRNDLGANGHASEHRTLPRGSAPTRDAPARMNV